MNQRLLSLNYADGLLHFEHIRKMRYAVILESGGGATDGRYDIASGNPIACLFPEQILDEQHNPAQEIIQLVEFHTTLDNHQDSDLVSTLPFVSGAIGLISYECGKQFAGINRDDSTQPITIAAGSKHTTECKKPTPHFESIVGIYQWALIRDHLTHTAVLVADKKMPDAEWNLLCNRILDPLPSCVQNNANTKKHHGAHTFTLLEQWTTSSTKDAYLRQFDTAKQFIDAGDCYQINLTQRFSNSYQGEIWQAYLAVRNCSPAPFSCYFSTPNDTVISCSPERFLRIQEGNVTSFPIKGTRPKRQSDTEDAQQLAELSTSTKDRAENLMIVDLIRNDIGRFCKIGTVTVPELFRTRTFSNVHHLISQVQGEINTNNTKASLELFFGCLPGGSVTGAPKRRAMEIIDQLEPHQRSIYCGSAFYLSSNGNLDSNILIRSLQFNRTEEAASNSDSGQVFCWGGGGIVADSIAEDEYAESLYKIANLLNALNHFRR